MPYAIWAKFTHPDRPAIALAGNGAMQMNATRTAGPTRGWWSACSQRNDLNQVTWELRAMGGAPKFQPAGSARGRSPCTLRTSWARPWERMLTVSMVEAVLKGDPSALHLVVEGAKTSSPGRSRS